MDQSLELNNIHPKRKILVVVTLGGRTNTDPIFVICQCLHERGHTIELATLPGQQHWADGWPMVSKVHLCGRAVNQHEQDAFHMHLWALRGHQAGAQAKAYVDSFWPSTYSDLCALVENKTTRRPDFIIADYQCEAAKDVAIEHSIPYAVVFPQFPWMLPAARHVPGLSGLHERAICTEGASWRDRLWELSFPVRRAPDLVTIWRRNRAMRWENQQQKKRRMPQDGVPDYLVLVNAFEGFEIARELAPNCAAVGPLLADAWPPLDAATAAFLEGRQRVAYVAFGTHVMIDLATLDTITTALDRLIADGLLDGVILSLSLRTRERFAVSADSDPIIKLSSRRSSWHVVSYAPQRAILAHASTVVFVTHGGASSVQEAMFHGTPMVSLAVWGDQLSNALRIERAGIGRRVSMASFTAGDLYDAVKDVVCDDEDGAYARNVLRLQRIARVAARRKYRAADMIEEHLYDWELRGERPMHLQPPSHRLSWVKLYNVDIWLPILATVAVPVVLTRQVVAVASVGVTVAVMLLVLFVGRFNVLTDLARISSQGSSRKK